ncbi:MAG: STAS domain-containing protein [Flammeovirgaceae bacterium]
MNFNIEQKTGYTFIQVNKDKLDAIIAPVLKKYFSQLREEDEEQIILDLSQVKYIDSSGLTALLLGSRKCKNLILVSPQGMVMKMLEISQLDHILTIAHGLEEAKHLVNMEQV